MTDEMKNSFRVLFFIGGQKIGEKGRELLEKMGIPVQYHAFAKGTASGELVDLLGLTGIDKTVIISMLTKKTADSAVRKLQDELYLGSPNTGIAFTVPLSGATAGVLRLAETVPGETTERRSETMEGTFSMILAFVNQGFSEEVMTAGKAAGAAGGTVFHSRRVGSREAAHFWGVSIQEEREIVLILTKKEKKTEIMKAISDKCGAGTEAQGVVVSVPVDEIVGLRA